MHPSNNPPKLLAKGLVFTVAGALVFGSYKIDGRPSPDSFFPSADWTKVHNDMLDAIEITLRQNDMGLSNTPVGWTYGNIRGTVRLHEVYTDDPVRPFGCNLYRIESRQSLHSIKAMATFCKKSRLDYQ